MAVESPFIIQEHQFHKIKTLLARLCVESASRVVFLVDRDGQPIAFHGDIGDMDTTSFSSLAAGNVAATNSMAKLLGARIAWANADNAVQVHGGNGYALEYPVSRVLCDARILNIFEGAAEIQAQVIARGILEGRN